MGTSGKFHVIHLGWDPPGPTNSPSAPPWACLAASRSSWGCPLGLRGSRRRRGSSRSLWSLRRSRGPWFRTKKDILYIFFFAKSQMTVRAFNISPHFASGKTSAKVNGEYLWRLTFRLFLCENHLPGVRAGDDVDHLHAPWLVVAVVGVLAWVEVHHPEGLQGTVLRAKRSIMFLFLRGIVLGPKWSKKNLWFRNHLGTPLPPKP